MIPQKLVFHTAVEGLYVRALGSALTAPLKAELRVLGLDLDRPIPPAVPREVWYASLHATARHLFPHLERSEALRQLGIHMMRGVEHTLFGRALAPAVSLLGPRRILDRVPYNMRSTSNFSTGVITGIGPTIVRLDVDDVGDAPQLMQGSLERIVAWAGGKDVTVAIEPGTPPAASFLVRWTR